MNENITHMLQSTDLKKGCFVWWTRESDVWPGQLDWDVPCFVTRLDRSKNMFRVLALDTFKETEGLAIEPLATEGDSSLAQMYPCTFGDVVRFFLGRAPKSVPKERLNFLQS